MIFRVIQPMVGAPLKWSILEIFAMKFHDCFLTARTSLEFYFLKNFEEILEFQNWIDEEVIRF